MPLVRSAGFERHTFVQAPFYFQNLTMRGPQPLPDGRRGWAVPMDPLRASSTPGTSASLAETVAAAFGAGAELANGSYLAMCGGTYSWNDFVATLNALGHDVAVIAVPPEAYDGSFPGAKEVREMFQYFEAYTYFGPDAQTTIAAANALVPGGFHRLFRVGAQEHGRRAAEPGASCSKINERDPARLDAVLTAICRRCASVNDSSN